MGDGGVEDARKWLNKGFGTEPSVPGLSLRRTSQFARCSYLYTESMKRTKMGRSRMIYGSLKSVGERVRPVSGCWCGDKRASANWLTAALIGCGAAVQHRSERLCTLCWGGGGGLDKAASSTVGVHAKQGPRAPSQGWRAGRARPHLEPCLAARNELVLGKLDAAQETWRPRTLGDG